MSDLGEILKTARTEKGITLDELQDQTKIRKTYLEAIEAGNYKILPGNFYVRAFIKSYAEAVGLDPAEVMSHYQNDIPKPEPEPAAVENSRPRSSRLRNTDKIAKWASSLLLLSFIVLIAVVIYTFVVKGDDGSNESVDNNPPITDSRSNLEAGLVNGGDEEQADDGEKPADNGASEEQEPEQEPVQEVEVSYVGTDSSTYIYTINNTKELSVEFIAANGECWAQVKSGNSNGEVLVEKKYNKGEQETFTAQNSLWIRMGNPSAVQIKVNGKLIEEEKLKESSPWNIQLNLSNSATESPA
ncbi:helix-turn-helix domain-containing protein [Marinicrinis lubricantis]|uniref:Helix-turn-helix domain-containing protein n=1 Tax=Marinicrinis lubricantis TaxID=2086470 RepID=A0ABW1IM90_9BACL